MIMGGFGCVLSYWTRQAIKEGLLKIFPIISEREAFNNFSFGKVVGVMSNRFFFEVKILLSLFSWFWQVALTSALTWTFIRGIFSWYRLLIFNISIFKTLSVLELKFLGEKPSFVKPCLIRIVKISFKSPWEMTVNFRTLSPPCHFEITLLERISTTLTATGSPLPISELWMGREGLMRTRWFFAHPEEKIKSVKKVVKTILKDINFIRIRIDLKVVYCNLSIL